MKCICKTNKGERCKNNSLKHSYLCHKHQESCKNIEIQKIEEDNFIIGKVIKKKEVYWFNYNGNINILKLKKPRDIQSLNNYWNNKFFDWHECLILRKFDHANLIKILNCGIKDENLFIIFERCCGDITEFNFDKNLSSSCHSQILTALSIIQEKQIVHRDIHRGNILWKPTSLSKIEDIPTFNVNFLLTDFENSLCLDVNSDVNFKKYAGRRIQRIDNTLKFETLKRCYNVYLDLNESIPLDFYFDIYSLYRCLKNEKFLKSYENYLSSIVYINFDDKFTTNRLDLFLASEAKKKTLQCFS